MPESTDTYAALLRGINVGGHNKVPMGELRTILQECGYTNCVTHLQSGNAVFTAGAELGPRELERTIEAAIRDRLHLDIPVLIRTSNELKAVVTKNPISEAIAEPSKFFVTFLSKALATSPFDDVDLAPDVVKVMKREIYTWCPEGMSNSQFFKLRWEKQANATATTRNWNTVTKLLALMEN